MMTSTIRKFGVGVASLALVASTAAPAFAANENLREVPGPMDGLVNTDRLGGYDRIDTAITIAEKAFSESPDDVEVAYLASSETASAVDSAAAGHLSDGPIYLVAGDNRSQDAVANSINKNFPNVQKIVAIGGTKAVSDATLKGVSGKVLAETTTQRVSGKDRYETAAAIAEYGSTHKGMSQANQFVDNDFVNFKDSKVKREIGQTKVYLARGDNPVDALVSGVLTDAPVLLLGPDGSVPEATAAYLKKHLPTHFVALGGEKAVPTDSFLKAEFDPLKQNVWTNNEAVKSAKEAKAYAEFLLKGAPSQYDAQGNLVWEARGLNPKIKTRDQEEKLLGKAKNDDQAATEKANQELYKSELKRLTDKLGEEDDADTVSTYYGELAAAKKAAEAAAKIDDSNSPDGDQFDNKTYKALADAAKTADENLNGKSDWSDASPSTRGSANYSGSVEALNRAELALKQVTYATDAVKAIDEAVNTYNAEFAAAGSDSGKKKAAAKKLHDALVPYITHYYDGSTHKALSAMAAGGGSDTEATAFAGSSVWGASNGGAKGFMTTTTSSAGSELDGSGAGKFFAPTADYSTSHELGTTVNTSGEKVTAVNFTGIAAGAATSAGDVTKLEQAVDAAKALMGKDEKAKAEADALWKEALEQYKTSSAVKAKALKKAEDTVTSTVNRIAQLKKMLNGGVSVVETNYAFMGYEKIEQRYKAVYDAYNYLKSSKDSAIRSKVRDLIAQETTSPEQVVASLSGLVADTYHVELKLDNVDKFFAFRKDPVTGQRKVTNPIVAAMSQENNDLVGLAVEMVNDFYAYTDEGGFDKGDMRNWFATSDYTRASMYKNYTDKKKQLAALAAKTIVRAVDYSDTGLADIPGGVDAVTRVSSYLEQVARHNRESASTQLAKAIEELQKALDKVLPKRYDRIDGKDRYATSAAIAGYWRAAYVYEGGTGRDFNRTIPLNIYIANGDTYIDAVAGGQLKKGPIVLVNSEGKLTDQVKQRFAFAKTDTRLLTIYALGGGKAVSDSVLVDAKAAAYDKSWLGKNLFSDATNKAADNAKEKKAEDKKADEKKADDKK